MGTAVLLARFPPGFQGMSRGGRRENGAASRWAARNASSKAPQTLVLRFQPLDFPLQTSDLLGIPLLRHTARLPTLPNDATLFPWS